MSIESIPYARIKPGEIRLVALQPGEKHDAIECKIDHSILGADGDKNYNALSYMWGSPDAFRVISVDGRSVQVRENLWSALIHLRSKEDVVVLWVDAVCINQADTEERSSQVAQMGRIYQRATQVMIWVGPESPNDANALHYISRIYDDGHIPAYFHYEFRSEDHQRNWFQRYFNMWEEISVFCARPY